jgi:hypothetical protein
VNLLTVGSRNRLQNIRQVANLREDGTILSLAQLIFGAAAGYLLGQAALEGMKRVVGWLQRNEPRERAHELFPWRGSDLIRGFIKYAGLIGAVAALITFGVWSVGDYLAAKSERRTASANSLESSETASPSVQPQSAQPRAQAIPPSAADSAVEGPVSNLDPYADADFKVQRRPQRSGGRPTLRDTLVQRSEARARADLLSQTRELAGRSQYDCETAARASKYLTAGLDVWGFAAWQVKYFSKDDYKGATLPECKDIKNLIS